MAKLFFKYIKTTPNRLYLLNAFIDITIALCFIIKTFCYVFLVHSVTDKNKDDLELEILRLIKNSLVGFIWLTWLLYLLYNFKQDDSFLTFGHKIYFLTKFIMMLFLIPLSVFHLITDYHHNLGKLLIIPFQIMIFTWNKMVLDRFKKDKVGHLNSVTISVTTSGSNKNDKKVNNENQVVEAADIQSQEIEKNIPQKN